jgi:hypothetical protein
LYTFLRPGFNIADNFEKVFARGEQRTAEPQNIEPQKSKVDARAPEAVP